MENYFAIMQFFALIDLITCYIKQFTETESLNVLKITLVADASSRRLTLREWIIYFSNK